MYKIKYNDAVICTPQFKEFAAIAGKLQEGLNAVSVFSFTLPPNHLYLDSIEGRNGLVKLYDDDNVLFIGDIVNRKENFDCTTEIECQDALGWLNDVVFVKPTFSGAIENYWAYLLGRYNQEASEWRKINIGTVTVQGNISINHDTEFLTIFDLVSELTKLSGGYVSVRYEGEEIFLDYLAQANTESGQSILFGTNLINLEDFVSEEQIFSRIYPRGKDGLDISSVNDGLTYLANGITESMFGIVAVTVDFDTESATELKALGQAYLEANGLASRTLTLTAFDLSLVDKNYTEIKVGNIIPVISPLHGINTKMQVNAKTTDIVTPENSVFTLGLMLNTISGIMASGGTSNSGQINGSGGTAATISIGTVTTGAAGSDAQVTNSGTSTAAVLNFVIPRGDKGESAATDYVVEQGTSNGWNYRKWNNGYAECWATMEISGEACTNAVSSWYHTDELKFSAYPFTFAETPNVNMFFETGSGTGGLVWPAGTASEVINTVQPHRFYIIRMASSNAISGLVHIQVKGKWK